jgi:hypothetical protein
MYWQHLRNALEVTAKSQIHVKWRFNRTDSGDISRGAKARNITKIE